MSRDLRREQGCPGWCEGNDHKALAEEAGTRPSHYLFLAELPGWVCSLEQPLEVGATVIRLSGFGAPERQGLELASPSLARSLAAWLIRAAEEWEFRG